MKKKLFQLLMGACWWSAKLMAQPAPCTHPAKMTSTCPEACVICDIDGFSSNNSHATYPGIAPPDFCTSTVHNIQWMAFMAGSQDLTLRIAVSNCQNGGGLEMGVYQSLDCKTFQRVMKCDGNIPPNTSETFQNIVPLTIGQFYYLVIDGNMGDRCNYTISVVNGTTHVSKLHHSGVISGNTTFCPGNTTRFSIDPPAGATQLAWTLDGLPVGNTKSIEISPLSSGTYQLCCTASNACEVAPPTCTTLLVRPPSVFLLQEKLCGNDCLSVSDTIICESGDYRIVRKDRAGCDSVFVVRVEKFPTAQTFIQTHICSGDTLYMAGKPFSKTGVYTEKLTTVQGCDSTLTLDLTAVICELQGSVAVQNVSCYGTKTGSIQFQVTQGTPPFRYEWQRLGHSEKGTGDIQQLLQPVFISHLGKGTYAITVTDHFNNDVILMATVEEELPLRVSMQVTDFQGFNVSCFGASNGKITAIPAGGRAPYRWTWSNGTAQNALENVPAGHYSLTLTDANGCTALATTTLSEPPPLQLSVSFANPDCSGWDTGLAQVLSVSGGVKNYVFSLNGSAFSGQKNWEKLAEGHYRLVVRDANLCADTFSFQLFAPDIPTLRVEKELEVLLGDAIQLQLHADVVLQQIAWTPAEWLSCTDCPDPVARPLHDAQFFVEAKSLDNCVARDSVSVRVRAIRDVYAPNIFSPNGDGKDDFFQIFGSVSVKSIYRLSIYNRWGELLFDKRNLPHSDISTGWDGTFRHRPAPPGVYVWIAEIEYLDGKKSLQHGNVALVR